ncbi:DMT family transporter [Fluviibacterium sp. DFM31]|uniref:DMT family transporter n=1 Tax=Meridianimarinicoccus marinus TaxID=3231483 RepID=A0ABV3L694_9RHOB
MPVLAEDSSVASRNLRGAFLMTLSMAAFVGNDACMRAMAGTLPVAQILVLRSGVTALILLALAIQGGLLVQLLRLERRGWALVALRSLAEIWTAFSVLISLQHLSLSTFTAIIQAGPLSVALAGAVFLKEPMGWRRLVAILIGFGGVMIIIRPGTEVFDIWSLAGLSAVAGFTLRDLTARRVPAHFSPILTALCGAIAVLLAAAVISPAVTWQMPTPPLWAGIVAAAMFSAAAYVLAVRCMQVGEIAFVTPFRYTGLLWALLLGVLFLGERPDLLTMVGAAIVLATGGFTLYREHQARRRSRRA